MDAAAGRDVPQPAAALRRAVGGYLDHLTVERALAGNTLSAYRRDLDPYLRWLAVAAVVDLPALTPRQIAADLATLREGRRSPPPPAPPTPPHALRALPGLHP